MAETNTQKLDQLQLQLEALIEKQASFSSEINLLKSEIMKLKLGQSSETAPSLQSIKEETKLTAEPIVSKPEPQPLPEKRIEKPEPKPEKLGADLMQATDIKVGKSTDESVKVKPSLESFIGGNLINKVGIAITVIGVGIGAKYSIDHNLISPVMRLILGYVIATGLLGFAFKLKKKYEAYSAVLLGGSMAIMYFLTYLGYSYYEIIPQVPAFLLMVVFTAFTVYASTIYNLVIIAHIGLIGAYAIPILLSSNSGKVEVLFSYMVIVNMGILALAFKRGWRSLYIPAFVLSWIIFGGWFMGDVVMKGRKEDIAIIFGGLFFLIFYATFLAQVIANKMKLAVKDASFILSNAAFFYLAGYFALAELESGERYQGLFTLINAIIHFGVSAYLYRSKRTENAVYDMVLAVVLTFLTITIPVQLNGEAVTLLWLAEAAALAFVGAKNKLPVFQKMSLPVFVLGMASLLEDWGNSYPLMVEEQPVFNLAFMNSLLATAFVAAQFWIQKKFNTPKLNGPVGDLVNGLKWAVPALLIFLPGVSIFLELESFFNIWQDQTKIDFQYNPAVIQYGFFVKTMFFVAYTFVLWLVSKFIFRNKSFAMAVFGLNTLSVMLFMVWGLYTISEMRDLYLEQPMAEWFSYSSNLIWLRYVGILMLGANMYALTDLIKRPEINEWAGMSKDFALHTIILWLLSSELLHWLSLGGSANQYKLGLSILWGCYALLIVILGLWKRKKLLRFSGIGLFGLTLVKLFFYDIAHLGTISKTIVFVSLGILLLIVSFLYNKYKDILDDQEA